MPARRYSLTTYPWMAMASTRKDLCYEVAGQVLAGERGLNTPQKRLELAAELEGLIDRYINFERKRARSAVKGLTRPPSKNAN